MCKEDKVSHCCECGKETVTKGPHAGNLVRAAAAVSGGKGGGRPDSAMAGGNDASKLDEMLSAIPQLLSAQL
jgi:alanyl-tRNA synthetase